MYTRTHGPMVACLSADIRHFTTRLGITRWDGSRCGGGPNRAGIAGTIGWHVGLRIRGSLRSSFWCCTSCCITSTGLSNRSSQPSNPTSAAVSLLQKSFTCKRTRQRSYRVSFEVYVTFLFRTKLSLTVRPVTKERSLKRYGDMLGSAT